MDRKDFLKKTLALCGVAMIPVGVMESCSKTSYSGPSNVNFTVDLTNTSNASLNAVGGSLMVNGLILTHPASASFEAFSATCTHQGCTVGYQSSNNTLVCPCHGGVYNGSTGAVVSGPPPSALTKYNVTQTGNTLTIKSA